LMWLSKNRELTSMNCSIIIPTWLRAELLSETLDSLACQSDNDFEVIIVCDGEDPQTHILANSYLAKYSLRWIFNSENKGQASARNAGAAVAKGGILLFLDDDTSAAPDWVFQHRKNHDAHSSGRALAVCGKIIETYDYNRCSHTERFLREQNETILADFEAHLSCSSNVGLDRYSCCGLNCSIGRTTFLNSGGFDPALRHIHEDLELGSRLYNQGIQFLFEPHALVYHHSTKDLKEYHTRCWSLSGRTDVYRVREKHQRNAQTEGLRQLHHGSAVRRFKARVAWDHPDAVREVAELCSKATEITGSKAFFKIWSKLAFTLEYWEGVKSEGLTLDSLRRLVGAPLPVLAFHSISVPTSRNERKYCLSPQRFCRFIQWLNTARYSCVTPVEWLSGVTPARSVLLTFDDGYDDFYTEVFPSLDRFELKPTVFVVVSQIGKSNVWDEMMGGRSRQLLSLQQIREMHRYGVQFGSHTLTHAWLPDLSNTDLRREVVDSKFRLEDLLGSEVTCFAYPSGGVDRRVRAAVAQAGYAFGMTTREGLNFWEDPMCLKRIEVGETDTIIDFALKLATGRDIKQGMFGRLRRLLQDGLVRMPSSLSHIFKKTLRNARTGN
jgi:GT2 family glycosyltransferase/peptidoglycan/xylan/chitin deacetylase (PgdA/CDA1 family)